MMYTPTPAARRPRPPGSIARSRVSSRQPEDAASSQSSSSSIDPNNPFSDYIRQRQDHARSSLARISASPGDVGDVSLGLDVVDPTPPSSAVEHISVSAKPRLSERIGLGLPSALSLPKNMESGDAQPSPPPPYGLELVEQSAVPAGRTPPRVDSGVVSRRPSTSPPATDHQDERARLRRANDAMRAIGLEVDSVSSSDGIGEYEDEENEVSDGQFKRRYREMRMQLKRRNEELAMAARVAEQALRTHEQVIAVLPSSLKARIPHLVNLLPSKSSSTTPPRPQDSIISSYEASVSRASQAPLTLPMPSSQRGGGSHILHSPPDVPLAEVGSHPLPHRRLHSQPSSSHTSNMSPNYSRLTAQQAEADERIAVLEQALHDARDGEEKQRKAVARMRKDLEKLQREYERVEERVVAAESEDHGRPAARDPVVWRRRESTIDKDLRSSYMKAAEAEKGASQQVSPEQTTGWGATSFPEYPTHAGEGELGEVLDRLSRMTVETGQSRSAVSGSSGRSQSREKVSRAKMQPADQAASSSSSPTRAPRSTAKSVSRRSSSLHRHAALSAEGKRIRKKISKSSFALPTPERAKPAIPLTPRVTVNAPVSQEGGDDAEAPSSFTGISGGRSKSRSSSARRKSPWPSPRASVSRSPNPRTTLDFSRPSSRAASVSPGFASLSSRMASMRNYVASTLGVASAAPAGGRTLGSELGSEFGDDWNHTLHSLDDLEPKTHVLPIPRYQNWESDEDEDGVGDAMGEDDSGGSSGCGSGSGDGPDVDGDDGEDGESQYANSPAPLPPTVSAALSSLAIALAPTSMFLSSTDSSVPILPKGSLREPGLDYSAYELLSEAVRLRKIRWADGAGPARDHPYAGPSHSAHAHSSHSRSADPHALTAESLARGGSGWAQWRAEDPWEGGDYPDELSLSDSGARPSRLEPRPAPMRTVSGSTDTSVALAHRRIVSQPPRAGIRERKFSPLRHSSAGTSTSASTSSSTGTSSSSPAAAAATTTTHGAAAPSTPRFGRFGAASTALARGDGTAIVVHVRNEDGTTEPMTIPGRVVSDLICLLGMLVEYLEWWVIVCWRVSVEFKYGQRAGLGLGRRVRRRRYYF